MFLLYEISPASQPKPTVTQGDRINTLPFLILNLHTQCNCRCLMCDIWQRKESRLLTASDLTRQSESLKRLGVRQVVLTGGEPLLNPELGDICDLLHELNIKVTLLTTGLLLRSRAALVARSIDDIVLSLDGPPEVHNAIRRIPRAFEVIARGVAAVRLLRPALKISCRTTVQKQNHGALRATVDAAHALQLNSISFLPVDVSTAAFNRQEPWTRERCDEVGLCDDEVTALECEVEALIETRQADIQTKFILEGEDKLRRIVRRFRERLAGTRPIAPICNAPWVSAVMEVDGSVRPCFFHPATGSTQGATLEQALNNSAAVSFRSSLDVKNNPTCQRCVCSLSYRA